ncbi:hypothetical protein RUM43_001216 [Polyplax serrata]|uniref:Regulator of microtubule dynamics protein 1 n=1 Tax=Polyplax serrata TaxID=468196 RepID=A0AAN8SDP9_POLSC
MSTGDGFSSKKTLLTVGAGVLIGAAGLLTYYAHNERRKTKNSQQKPVSDLTLRDFLSLRKSSAYENSITGSSETLTSRRTYKSCYSSCKSEYDTASEMYSIENTEADDSEYYDISSDDEDLALSLNEENSVNERENVKQLFDQVDLLMKGNDGERLKALHLLKKKEFELTENPEFLWRFAKAHQIQASISSNPVIKKQFVYEGLEYASKAVALDSTNSDAHKWFAILTGMQTDFLPIKEKIQTANVFQEHLLLALKYKECDYSLHYLLARFKYEIANTSWWERKMAAALLGELPSFTYSDAIKDLQRSEELSPTPSKQCRLLLAKCYVGEGKYETAIEHLDSAKGLPVATKEDEVFDQEIDGLIVKYQGYRKL